MRPGLLFTETAAHPLGEQLTEDLGLSAVIDAMAAGDPEIAEAAGRVLLSVPPHPAHVTARQDVLADCADLPDLPRELYELAGRAVDAQRGAARAVFFHSPETVLNQSIATLSAFLQLLRELRTLTGRHRLRVTSAGFRQFFAMVDEQLDDAYLDAAARHLDQLRFRGNLLVSARLGGGNHSEAFVIRRPVRAPGRGLFRRGGEPGRPTATYKIPYGDEAGHRALSTLRDQSLAGLADAADRSAQHVLAFFTALRSETAFYLGCLNLRQALADRGAPVCRPTIGESALTAVGLYDPALQLRLDQPVVTNDLNADGMSLIMVTGANRGGKSTFLRSLGLARLMASAGMFVAATALATAPTTGVFTHFTRDEDATLTSGKLDEELRRMSEIADAISPGSLLLCNESFQSTNEREGSDIARHIIDAMTEAGLTVVCVTHLHELAHACHADRKLFPAQFLRAADDHSFRLHESPPDATSPAMDLWTHRVLT